MAKLVILPGGNSPLIRDCNELESLQNAISEAEKLVAQMKAELSSKKLAMLRNHLARDESRGKFARSVRRG